MQSSSATKISSKVINKAPPRVSVISTNSVATRIEPTLQQHAREQRAASGPRPGLAIPRDHQGDEHGHRSSHKYQDYGGDAQEDPVLACFPLPFLLQPALPDSGHGRWLANYCPA